MNFKVKLRVLVYAIAFSLNAGTVQAQIQAKAKTIASQMDAAADKFDKEKYAEAAQLFQNVVKLDSKNALAWYLLGQSLDKSSDPDGAKKAYEYSLKVQSDGQVADLARAALNAAGSTVEAPAFHDCDKTDCSDAASLPSAPSPSGRADAETALWQAVVASNAAEDYGVYIQQYPSGKYLPIARNRLQKLKAEASVKELAKEASVWQSADTAETFEAYQDYVKLYPTGTYAALAQIRVKLLKENQAWQEQARVWQLAQKGDTGGRGDHDGLDEYLRLYPNGRHAVQARDAIAKAESKRSAGTLAPSEQSAPPPASQESEKLSGQAATGQQSFVQQLNACDRKNPVACIDAARQIIAGQVMMELVDKDEREKLALTNLDKAISFGSIDAMIMEYDIYDAYRLQSPTIQKKIADFMIEFKKSSNDSAVLRFYYNSLNTSDPLKLIFGKLDGSMVDYCNQVKLIKYKGNMSPVDNFVIEKALSTVLCKK